MLSGGGSTSPLFMQVFADVFGIPASRSRHGGASLGAAMCAAAAAGLHTDVEAAAEAMRAEREAFAPVDAHHEIYARILSDVYLYIRQASNT